MKKIDKNLGMTEEQLGECIDDGRIIGRFAEYWEVTHTGGKRAESEKSPYDVLTPEGKKHEVRSLTKNGVAFPSSKEIGSGRGVTEKGWLEKLNSLDLYSVYHYSPELMGYDRYVITKEDIDNIEKLGIMRKNKSVCKSKFLRYVNTRNE